MKIFKVCMILLFALFCTGIAFAGGVQDSDKAVDSQAEVRTQGASRQKAFSSAHQTDRIIADSETSITIIDDLGDKVVVPKPVEKIIILDGKSAHIFRGLQAEEFIIAHSSRMALNERLFPHITATPDIGKMNLDIEKIIELDPDLIIQSYVNMKEESEPLSPYFPIIRMAFENMEDISILGAVLDKEAEAEAYVNWIDSYIHKIEERVAKLEDRDKPDVFLYYGGHYGMSSPPPFGSYGKINVVGNQLVKRAGGRSITANLSGDYIDVESEWLIEQDPEIIVREYYFNSLSTQPVFGFDAVQSPRADDMMDTLISLPAMEISTAVRSKNVHILYGYFVQEYWFLGLCYLAEWFHSELFPDINAEQMNQEFVTDILRIDDFDVQEEGVFSLSLE